MAQAGVRGVLLAAATLGLAILGPAVGAQAQATAGASLPPRGAAALPAVRVVPGSLLLPAPGLRPKLPDTCGAAALAGLVGRLRTEIPVPVDLSRRRVACTACPVSPDVRLDRVNILYDAQTGRVAKITCG